MRMMSNFWMSNWATIHAFLGRYQAIQREIELKPNWLLASSSVRFVKFSRAVEHSSHSAHIGVPRSIYFLISFAGETQAVYTTCGSNLGQVRDMMHISVFGACCAEDFFR